MQVFTDVKTKVDQLGSKPRYILITDFKDVLAFDTKTEDTLSIPFKELPQKFEFFLAWNGIEKVDFEKENPADIRAAERFAKLYDVIVKDNPDASRHGLNLFLIRLLFCLFAEDTNIFEKDLFTNRLKQLTKPDGSDLDTFVKQLFSILDVKKEDRASDTPSYFNDFPYVDGDLFIEPHESLKFTEHSRKLIIDAGEKLDWDDINPDILGSMIQAVASEDSRSHLGMHYTSVPNIMKVIKPLFLDDLRKDFEDAKGNMKKLNALYDRIGKIKFMDPACGSGNFLIITYKELRKLEIDIIKEQNNMGVATMYVPSVILDQFYGIEIDDFACDVTRLSLWIAEHQMNVKLHEEIQDAVRPTLPLQHAGDIVCGNALRLDWNKILPHKADDEVYLFGNPPYLGYPKQNQQQKDDMAFIFQKTKIKYKKLDYISSWFLLGSKFILNSKAKYSFVTTNSIFEGEQVSILWTTLLNMMTINFAYKSFKWTNNAKNNAGVTVVIVGISTKGNSNIKKVIFNEKGFGKVVSSISPYLTDGDNTIVHGETASIFNLPKITKGSQPTDGGGLIFSTNEYNSTISKYPKLKKYLHKYIGSQNLLNEKNRYTLWLTDSDYQSVKNNPIIAKRMSIVYRSRIKSKKKTTNSLAKYPYKFGEIRYCSHSKLTIVLPAISSGNRMYVPITLCDNQTIISNTAQAIYNGSLWLLGLLESKMFMTWLYSVGGKFKTDYIISGRLVYNTFPVPKISTRRKNEIEDLVLKILDIREEEPGTLADLYGSPFAEKNPKPMNPRLLAAHQELDQVVDRAYKPSGFKDDNERLALLLDMYSKKVNELND